MNSTEALTIVLAQPSLPGGETGGQGPGFGKSTPLGLFLLIALLVAVAFLIRSMTKHLNKVSTTFDQDKATAAAPARVQRAEAASAREQAAGEGETGDEESPSERGEWSETESESSDGGKRETA